MKKLFSICAVIAAIASVSQATAQSNAEEQALAKAMLSALQERSFKQNREFCGFIARDADGKLFASKVYRGKQASCSARVRLKVGQDLLAHFHTHGRFLPRFDNEVPSAIDVDNEQIYGTRGYVATPGGRFWLIEGATGEVKLICGPGCLPVDPGYQERPRDRISTSYSAKQIQQRNNRPSFSTIKLCNGMLCTD